MFFLNCRFLALLSSLENIRNYVNISGDEANGWDVTFKNYTAGPNTVHVTKSVLDSNWVRPNWQDATTTSYGAGAGGDLDVRLAEYALNKLIYDSTGYSLKSTSYQQYSRYMFGTDDVSIYLNKHKWLNFVYNPKINTKITTREDLEEAERRL